MMFLRLPSKQLQLFTQDLKTVWRKRFNYSLSNVNKTVLNIDYKKNARITY